jgi:ribosomal protein L29
MSSFKDTTEKDLMKDIATKRVAVRTFRFGSSGSKTRNVKEAKGLKKDIARMLTELNSRKA